MRINGAWFVEALARVEREQPRRRQWCVGGADAPGALSSREHMGDLTAHMRVEHSGSCRCGSEQTGVPAIDVARTLCPSSKAMSRSGRWKARAGRNVRRPRHGGNHTRSAHHGAPVRRLSRRVPRGGMGLAASRRDAGRLACDLGHLRALPLPGSSSGRRSSNAFAAIAPCPPRSSASS